MKLIVILFKSRFWFERNLKEKGVMALLQENEKTIHRFLKENKQMHSKKINVANAINLKYGCQLLPSKKGSDGFYFALLHKK